MADVADMQLHLSDLIGRLNTWAARETRKENKDARLALEALGEPEPSATSHGSTPRGKKDALRAKVAEMRGLRRPLQRLQEWVPTHSEEETEELPRASRKTTPKEKKVSSE